MGVKTKNKLEKNAFPPAMTPEAREAQLIALANDVAEQQMRDGTASAQVITHYLKLGTEKARLERAILQEQARLYAAKTEELESRQRSEALYEEAIAAMRRYSGVTDDEAL